MAEKNYLIGNAHLDPVWQWRVSEGLSLIRSTFRSALDRMKENENYKVTSACAGYYQWIKNIDPDMFKEIQERIKEETSKIWKGLELARQSRITYAKGIVCDENNEQYELVLKAKNNELTTQEIIELLIELVAKDEELNGELAQKLTDIDKNLEKVSLSVPARHVASGQLCRLQWKACGNHRTYHRTRYRTHYRTYHPG